MVNGTFNITTIPTSIPTSIQTTIPTFGKDNMEFGVIMFFAVIGIIIAIWVAWLIFESEGAD